MSPGPTDVRDHLERLRRGHAILRALRLRELERRAIEERVALRRRLAGGRCVKHTAIRSLTP